MGTDNSTFKCYCLIGFYRLKDIKGSYVGINLHSRRLNFFLKFSVILFCYLLLPGLPFKKKKKRFISNLLFLFLISRDFV